VVGVGGGCGEDVVVVGVADGEVVDGGGGAGGSDGEDGDVSGAGATGRSWWKMISVPHQHTRPH